MSCVPVIACNWKEPFRFSSALATGDHHSNTPWLGIMSVAWLYASLRFAKSSDFSKEKALHTHHNSICIQSASLVFFWLMYLSLTYQIIAPYFFCKLLHQITFPCKLSLTGGPFGPNLSRHSQGPWLTFRYLHFWTFGWSCWLDGCFGCSIHCWAAVSKFCQRGLV